MTLELTPRPDRSPAPARPVTSLRPRRVAVTFGKPMTFPEHRGLAGKGKARREVTDAIMGEIAALSGQEKAGWGTSPGAPA